MIMLSNATWLESTSNCVCVSERSLSGVSKNTIETLALVETLSLALQTKDGVTMTHTRKRRYNPTGIGTVANTIAAALSAHDKNQSGFITTDDLMATLQQMNFGTATDVPLFRHLTLDMSGLKEHEVRELLLHHDPTASSLSSKDGVVHYRSQFDVPRDPEDDKIEDPLTRQAKYIAGLQQRVAAASQVPVPTAVGRRRQHHRKNDINTTKLGTLDPHQIPTTTTPPEESSADPPHLPRLATAARPPTKVLGSHRRLVDKATDDVFCVEDLEAALRTHLPSPTRYSAKLAPGIVPQTVSTLVLGGDMRNTPKSLKRAKLMPQIVDQYHRDATRQAKRHVITVKSNVKPLAT
ncbi:hypothetical protein DYB38_013786 [Aphanomyces astaci]|uniref:EF-hand domain-containing protein n=1 Tax=Aphanomyces astaci TaxID=112090 RepID=A0A397BYL1_APHAT|nr:hypothetical protein DYB38_013786 [Aphanomyces astaci]